MLDHRSNSPENRRCGPVSSWRIANRLKNKKSTRATPPLRIKMTRLRGRTIPFEFPSGRPLHSQQACSRYSALLSAPTMSTRSRERLVIALMINVNSNDIAAAIAYVGSSTMVSKYSDGMRKITVSARVMA